MDASKKCQHIKDLLLEQPIDKSLVKKEVKELVDFLNQDSWEDYELEEMGIPYIALMEKGLYEEALEVLFVLKENTTCFQNTPGVFFYIGKCYFLLGDYDKAENNFMTALHCDFDEDDSIYEYLREIEKKNKK